MIIEEIIKIRNHSNVEEIGELENNLYNEFREGRNRNDILELLNSDIYYIRYYGCDILNETRINDDKFVKKIMNKLYDILINDDFDINKLRAYHALYGIYLDNEDINGLFSLCDEMKNNSDIMIKNDSIKFIKKYKSVPNNYTFNEFLSHLYNK